MRILTYITLLIFTSCIDTVKYDYNNDFSVVCHHGFDKIDLKNQTLKRVYLDGEKTVHFELSENDKQCLFDILINKKIWKISDNDLKDTCDIWIEPSKSTYLNIQMTSKDNFEFNWHDSECSITKIDDLEEFVTMLYLIIEKDISVKKMSQTDIYTK